MEATIPLDPGLYSQTINLPSLVAPLTRFRKWKYVKVTGDLQYLKYIDPQNVFVPGGVQQTNCYYMIGSDLTVLLRSLATSLEVGYYQHPRSSQVQILSAQTSALMALSIGQPKSLHL